MARLATAKEQKKSRWQQWTSRPLEATTEATFVEGQWETCWSTLVKRKNWVSITGLLKCFALGINTLSIYSNAKWWNLSALNHGAVSNKGGVVCESMHCTTRLFLPVPLSSLLNALQNTFTKVENTERVNVFVEVLGTMSRPLWALNGLQPDQRRMVCSFVNWLHWGWFVDGGRYSIGQSWRYPTG